MQAEDTVAWHRLKDTLYSSFRLFGPGQKVASVGKTQRRVLGAAENSLAMHPLKLSCSVYD